MRVVRTTARTTFEEKAEMTPEKRQVAWDNDKGDELAKTAAIQDGAEVAGQVAEEGLDTQKKVYAAIRYAVSFLHEVRELVDMEVVSEEGATIGWSERLKVRRSSTA